VAGFAEFTLRTLLQLCMACRRRAPGFSETISPEMNQLRLSRKRVSKKYCKKADLHHVVADQAEAEAEGEDGSLDDSMGSGGELGGEVEQWTRPRKEEAAGEKPFNPLMG
jgi:hypothetical protein